VEAAAHRLARGQVQKRTVLSSWSSALDYCRTAMAFADKEQLRVLFLDKGNRLIADEVQQEGTVDHTPVHPHEVIKRALELSATAVILVHNDRFGAGASIILHRMERGLPVLARLVRQIAREVKGRAWVTGYVSPPQQVASVWVYACTLSSLEAVAVFFNL
jgi:hypothetical protein